MIIIPCDYCYWCNYNFWLPAWYIYKPVFCSVKFIFLNCYSFLFSDWVQRNYCCLLTTSHKKANILIKANTIASTVVVLQLLSNVPLLQKSDTVTAINREMIIKDYY